MRDHSDDEEGFIPSDLEIRNKYTLKLASIDIKHPTPTLQTHVKYRFADHFIKKEHPLCLITPLSLPSEQILCPPSIKRERSRQQWEHPYKYYCGSKEFDLVYSKHGDQPLLNERECIKNQVSLLNIEDKHSPSLKELKSFEYEQPEKSNNSDGLIFDSKFQNGNLHCAFRKKGQNEYHLFMQNDTNTFGYNQWFHFALRNTRKHIKYTFKLCNYRKRLRFFEQGQRIALFSLKDAEQTRNGWRWSGQNFAVEQSDVRNSQDKKFYTVSFRIQFLNDNDYIVLASSLPYSYSKLLQQLNNIQEEASKNTAVKLKVENGVASLCCNSVPQVTITARNSQNDKLSQNTGTKQSQKRQKKLIVIMARQHPGEVWSSFMVEGFMRNLIKDTPQAKYILQNYVVKIFPMINVDGVIYGNFRCDVTGVDLNRRWKEPSRIFHPHLFEIKKKLISYNKKWKTQLCLDLHGHSKKYNIFCYACKHNSYTCRILPLLIEKNTHLFNMPSCTFGLSKDKESTARAAISKIIKSENVLTVETSSFGWRSNENARQFNPIDLYKATQSICVAIRYFMDKNSACYREVEQTVHDNFSKFKEYDLQNQVESGSDSEPEQDQIDFKQKLATILDKKYEQEYKSFIKEDLTAHLHCSQLVFNQQDDSQKRNKSISSKELQRNQNNELEKSRKILEQSSRKIIRITRKNISTITNEEKKSLSINHHELGHHLNYTFRQPQNQKNNKNALQDKKSVSNVKEQKSNSQTLTVNPRQLREAARQEIGRSSIFKEAHRDEQKKTIQHFVQRFQKFIPSNIALKNNKAKYQMLEEGLENEDSSYQLNLMFENKRKLELQRIKKSIEQSTEIAERQGRLKKLIKKEPIVDFRRFKQMEKTKQSKRLGEFSERYLDSHF